MTDIEHPDITHANLTGYPRRQPEAYTHDNRCVTCNTVNGFIGFFYRLYDEYDFCSQAHLIDWLVKNGDVSCVEVGG